MTTLTAIMDHTQKFICVATHRLKGVTQKYSF